MESKSWANSPSVKTIGLTLAVVVKKGFLDVLAIRSLKKKVVLKRKFFYKEKVQERENRDTSSRKW